MYSRYFDEVVSKLFEEDPNGAIHAYEDMMKKRTCQLVATLRALEATRAVGELLLGAESIDVVLMHYLDDL